MSQALWSSREEAQKPRLAPWGREELGRPVVSGGTAEQRPRDLGEAQGQKQEGEGEDGALTVLLSKLRLQEPAKADSQPLNLGAIFPNPS